MHGKQAPVTFKQEAFSMVPERGDGRCCTQWDLNYRLDVSWSCLAGVAGALDGVGDGEAVPDLKEKFL